MTAAPPISWDWSAADIVAIASAVTYTLVAVALKPDKRTLEDIGGHISVGISLGPLLMIVFDPVARLTGYFSVSWLELVLTEGRMVLWWAAAIATLRLVWPLFSKS
jgi:predicted Kef-type K+ transport protein